MGKDGSGEPATKKFKQSQLCFKSPRSGNNNLKSKIISDSDSENKSNSPKTKILKQNNIPDSKTNVLNVSTPLRTDNSSDSSNEGLPIAKENDTTASVKNAPIIDSSHLENISLASPTKNDRTDASSPSSKTLSSAAEDISPMEVDNPVSTSCVENGESNSTISTINCDDQGSDAPISNTDLDIDEPGDNNASQSPQTPKSSKDDVLFRDDCISSPKSEISGSSDSEDDSDKATSSSSTPTTPKVPITPKMKRQMTPKMLQRLEESLKKKELLEQMKEEKRALKEKMRDEKMKQKVEEDEKKKQLKEEKKKKRLAELELKNEEKRLKKEDKRLKREKEEEEKNKKKELKIEEQKKEEKKKEGEERRKEAFASFFKKKSLSSPGGPQNQSFSAPATSENPTCPTFMPFPMKSDMRLAAVCRRKLEDESRQKFEAALLDEEECGTYLSVLKEGSYTPNSASATWPAPTSEELHDCIIIESQVDEGGRENGSSDTETITQAKTSHRAKLLQFCENRRPAYFGTWTKSSKEISGRKPFAKDSKGVLDYEVDSDSDWEEEEEGEDLENMKEDENEGQEEEVVDGENGYLLDNTFVPHGYLSDEEQPEDEELQESVEKQKDRLVALREEFDEEMKQGGAQALKPRLLGCLWVSNSTTQVSKGSLYEVLLGHRAVWEESNGSVEVEGDPTPSERSPNTAVTPSTKKTLPPIVMQEIARMVEGSRWPLSKLVREVGEVLTLARPQNPVSRLALTRTIKHLASKTLDSKENSIWTIKPEFRAEYNLQEVEVNTPTDVTPEQRSKSKDTFLDTFLKGQQPPAKKRISLTPIPHRKDNDKTTVVSPTVVKTTSDVTITKKKVAFVTLPPRTPNSNKQTTTIPRTPGPWTSSDGQITIKPHVDTPRPTINKFVNKDKQTLTPPIVDVVEISDDSNL